MKKFQFQFGAIKSGVPIGNYLSQYLFQFQFGAIKRSERFIRNGHIHIFQFQFGAIKSLVSGMECLCNPNFNSNLVRLKALIS